MNWKLSISLAFALCLTLYLGALGQDFEKDFSRIKEAHQRNYNRFVDQNDKEFADFLRSNWRTFQLNLGEKNATTPKPEEIPQHQDQDPKPFELPIKSKTRSLDLQDELEMPVNYKVSTYQGDVSTINFYFFGTPVAINHPVDFFELENRKPSPDFFADFWNAISEKDYRLVLDDLFRSRKELALNDYGYYMLIRDYVAKTEENKDIGVLVTWFLLTKSKFKARIGYTSDKVYLLLSSRQKIYETTFMVDDDITYYLMDFEKGSEIYAYDKDYREAYKTIDFSIKKPIKLANQIASRNVDVLIDGDSLSMKLDYNLNAIKFYDAIPPVELSSYFRSVVTASVTQSIVKNLEPVLVGKSQLEQVSFILSLVQNGFRYQIDDIQFGFEKAFFPEEMLHYQFSDCEDRSVFFAYLISTLTDLEVIGLDYPEHVATAVHFPDEEVPGDYYIFEDKKYVVCDPTYIGAPVGASIRNMTAQKAEIILKDPPESTIERLTGLDLGSALFDSWFVYQDNNKYMLANYQGEIKVNDKTYQGNNKSILLAKVDNGLVTSEVSLATDGVDFDVLDTKVHHNGFLILYQKTAATQAGIFLAKLAENGQVLWSKKVHDQEPAFKEANLQVTLYNAAGRHLAGKSYAETSYFNGRMLETKDDKILTILPLKK